jgi:hypothetical protein
VAKIPRTLIRLTKEGRKALERYAREMKDVLGTL